jgi:hypothetical protein
MILMEAIATIGLYFYLRYRNQVKERESDTPEAQAKRPISLDVIGDGHPGIFTLKLLIEILCIMGLDAKIHPFPDFRFTL